MLLGLVVVVLVVLLCCGGAGVAVLKAVLVGGDVFFADMCCVLFPLLLRCFHARPNLFTGYYPRPAYPQGTGDPVGGARDGRLGLRPRLPPPPRAREGGGRGRTIFRAQLLGRALLPRLRVHGRSHR